MSINTLIYAVLCALSLWVGTEVLTGVALQDLSWWRVSLSVGLFTFGGLMLKRVVNDVVDSSAWPFV